MERPQFDKLMDKLQDGDTLVVTNLDRMARSTSAFIVLIKESQKRFKII